MSVYARRLGSPLDSVLEIFDAKGQSLAANDDAVGADSSLKFTPPETTNYFVRIRDTLGQGGRDYAYRVEVVPVAPHLEVKIPEVARNDTQSRQYIAVPRGNRFATLISAKRANFGGELVFGAEGLPPGVTLRADRMAANVDAMPLVFEAAPDAAIGGKLLDLTATWTNGTSKVTGTFHQDIELVQGPNNTAYYSTSVDKLCVAVTRHRAIQAGHRGPEGPAGAGRFDAAGDRRRARARLRRTHRSAHGLESAGRQFAARGDHSQGSDQRLLPAQRRRRGRDALLEDRRAGPRNGGGRPAICVLAVGGPRGGGAVPVGQDRDALGQPGQAGQADRKPATREAV